MATNLSRNLLSEKVLLIEVKLSSSSFVRGAFVVQVNPIEFEECGGNMERFKMPQFDWLHLNDTSAARITELGFNNEDPVAKEINKSSDTWKIVMATHCCYPIHGLTGLTTPSKKMFFILSVFC